MSKIFNPGNVKFRKLLDSDIYVDKSGLLSFTNKKIGKQDAYICVSRPRRFGKSAAANMLCAYYSRGCDSRELFQGLKISQDESYEKHLNKYNVIQVDMQFYFNQAKHIVSDLITKLSDTLVKKLESEYNQLEFDENDLYSVLDHIYDKTGIPFVFIIDEWDCIFRSNTDDKERVVDKAAQREYLDFLHDLLKEQEYVALAYMTGILPIKKYGEHSALNMFMEKSMTNAVPIQEYTGFTEDEVKELCVKHGGNYEDIKTWYDGYTVDGVSIYNPNSVYEYLSSKKLDNYWTHTETYEALERYIRVDSYGIQGVIKRLIVDDTQEIEPDGFTNNFLEQVSLDDILTLLVHLGYLTYDSETKRVRIPNEEVRKQFIITTERLKWDDLVTALHTSQEVLDATLACDEKRVAELIEDVHREDASVHEYHSEIALRGVIKMAYYAAKGKYTRFEEYPTGNGFADLVYLPKEGVTGPALVVELKCDKSAQTALDQIKEKKYASPLRGYSGDILLIGINYDKKSKEHTCRIEKITK